MKNKILDILVIMLFITVVIPTIGATELLINRESNVVTGDLLDGGWIEELDGVTILYLNGSNYDMGYQHGSLLKDEIKENMWMIGDWFERKGFTYDVFLRYGM